MEIVKKLIFQGKKWDEEPYHFVLNPDVMWYVTQCLIAWKHPLKVVEMNVEKLKKRYPGGSSIPGTLRIVRRRPVSSPLPLSTPTQST